MEKKEILKEKKELEILEGREENSESHKNKKKTIDEKIEELREKLKLAELEKKKSIERKGKNLWLKIKSLFLTEENVVDEILNEPEKLENLKKSIINFLKEEEKKKALKQKENKKTEGVNNE